MTTQLNAKGKPISFRRMTLNAQESQDIERISTRAKVLLDLLIPRSFDSTRRGGQLGLNHIEQSEDGGQQYLVEDAIIQIGTIVPQRRISTYYAIVREKARRLFEHRLQHQLSYQSRAPGQGRYGGAVLSGHQIWGFSGLEEADDDALVLNLMLWEEELVFLEAQVYAVRSNNWQFQVLHHAACVDQRVFSSR